MSSLLKKTRAKRTREIGFACLALALVSLMLTVLIAPDKIDPLRLVTTIDAQVIKAIDHEGKRFVMYRVKPGKIFMVQSQHIKAGDIIKVDHYQRQLTRRVEYLPRT